MMMILKGGFGKTGERDVLLPNDGLIDELFAKYYALVAPFHAFFRDETAHANDC